MIYCLSLLEDLFQWTLARIIIQGRW